MFVQIREKVTIVRAEIILLDLCHFLIVDFVLGFLTTFEDNKRVLEIKRKPLHLDPVRVLLEVR